MSQFDNMTEVYNVQFTDNVVLLHQNFANANGRVNTHQAQRQVCVPQELSEFGWQIYLPTRTGNTYGKEFSIRVS
jgi:hypothetical protein